MHLCSETKSTIQANLMIILLVWIHADYQINVLSHILFIIERWIIQWIRFLFLNYFRWQSLDKMYLLCFEWILYVSFDLNFCRNGPVFALFAHRGSYRTPHMTQTQGQGMSWMLCALNPDLVVCFFSGAMVKPKMQRKVSVVRHSSMDIGFEGLDWKIILPPTKVSKTQRT